MKEKLEITAYKIMDNPPPIRTADRKREWMDDTQDRFAYRCLPLSIANQTGWEILSPAGFTARWNGKNDLPAIKIKFDDEESPLIGSHFGHGVLTFTLGYLFRTTKAHNLWVKGPTNQFKDGISALEGLIETDWTPFTFTMNWQFTRKRHKIRFEKDEPICTLLPYPRHYIGKFDPKLKVINENPKLYNQYVAWKDDREQFLRDLKNPDSEAVKAGWQKTYMKGEDQFGKVFAGHQTKVRTADFK
ncbi:MAG: hypothetical protein IID59_07970 [Proteobacteria bacterium]|nr:hypothetical protein [Pseudomonadota bacterium]